MAKILGSLAVFFGLTIAYFLFWPVPIDPVSWQPGVNPGKSDVHTENTRLTAVERLAEGYGRGPEDTTIGPDGFVYTG